MERESKVEVYTGNSRIFISGPEGITYEELGNWFNSANIRKPTSEGKNAMIVIFLNEYRHDRECKQGNIITGAIKSCGLEGKVDVSSNAVSAPPNYMGVTGVILTSEDVNFAVHSEPLDIELTKDSKEQ